MTYQGAIPLPAAVSRRIAQHCLIKCNILSLDIHVTDELLAIRSTDLFMLCGIG